MLSVRQKIVKAGGAEPDEFEAQVAQELYNLEVCLANINFDQLIIVINLDVCQRVEG